MRSASVRRGGQGRPAGPAASRGRRQRYKAAVKDATSGVRSKLSQSGIAVE
jgi:hypothetical protein